MYYNLAYTFVGNEYREFDVTETARAVRGSEIFTALKSRIIRWEYPPGYRFTEEEICKEFGVSRSPVRETLRMLEEHGLVDKGAVSRLHSQAAGCPGDQRAVRRARDP